MEFSHFSRLKFEDDQTWCVIVKVLRDTYSTILTLEQMTASIVGKYKTGTTFRDNALPRTMDNNVDHNTHTG